MNADRCAPNQDFMPPPPVAVRTGVLEGWTADAASSAAARRELPGGGMDWDPSGGLWLEPTPGLEPGTYGLRSGSGSNPAEPEESQPFTSRAVTDSATSPSVPTHPANHEQF